MMHRRAQCGAICVGLATLICFSACRSDVRAGEPLSSFSQEITSTVHDIQVKAGETYPLDLSVKNTGTQSWFGSTPTMSVRAGYRWHDSRGAVLPIEGNRAQLDRPVLRPGETARLQLFVVAPPTSGSYTLNISMVQEGFKWFLDDGAKPLVIPVAVK